MQKLPVAKSLKDYEHCESNYETIYLIHNYMEFERLLVKIKWDNIFKGDSQYLERGETTKKKKA